MATSTPVQLYTNAGTCVDDMLEGVCETNTALHLFKTHRILVDKRWLPSRKTKKNRVAILSGGGSGHEPFSAGYIGVGMLSGCVAGDVFTSPPSTDITAVIKTLAKNNEAGVLVIVFNYTGDRLNFGLAVEKCKAEGIKVETHISGDDTALTEVEGTAGRRGLCGTLFTIKIAGAMSERGYTLQQILNTCKELGQNTGTIGMSVSSCTLPGATHPLMNLQQGYMELGLGVHGEPGAACVKLGTLADTIEVMLTHLSDPTHTSTHLHLPPRACVCVMVNNLGGLTEMELSNITFQVVKELRKRNIKIVRIYKGSLMTSLDMRGTHISLLRIPGSEDSGSVDSVDSHPWIGLLDAPTTAPSWPTPYLWGGGEEGVVEEEELGVDISSSSMSTVFEAEPNEYTLNLDHSQILRSCLEAVVESMKKSEYLLNELDGVCGDGDCGSTIVKGVYGLAQHIDKLPITKPNSVLKILSEISSKNMGGTSGALYSILLTTAATTLTTTTTTTTTTGEANHRVRWSKALRAGTDAVTKYGGASVGDRTMLDALIPAIEVLESAPEHTDVHTLLRQMAEAADVGTKKTVNMKPRAGRASYVRAEKVIGTEDAGARCVTLILQAMAGCN